MNKAFKLPTWALILIIFLLILFPNFITSPYLVRLVILSYLWIIVNSSWNLVMGVSGIFSLAQLALFAIGGYTSAILAINFGISPWITMIIGAFAAVIASIIIGLPTLRLRGVYVVLFTLAFHEILRVLITTDESGKTGGAFGLQGIPRLAMPFWGEKANFLFNYYLALVFAVITLLILYRITYSPIGVAFKSLRDSERYATGRGVSPFRYKMLVFIISAFFTGLTGAFYAHYYTTVSPTAFSFGLMMNLMAMIVLGGWGTFAGPIIGTFVLLVLSEVLHGVEEFRLIIFGIVMTGVVVLVPGGLVSLFSQVSKSISNWVSEKE